MDKLVDRILKFFSPTFSLLKNFNSTLVKVKVNMLRNKFMYCY